MTTQLLLIDPQNDFCDFGSPADRETRPMPALPVPGALADMRRVAELLERRGEAIDSVVVTLDSHPLIGIERPLFWETGDGGEVEPFTVISAEDLRADRYRPAVRQLQDDDRVLDVLASLEAQGKPGVMIWPAHCVIGSWGHRVVDPLAEALDRWSVRHRRLIHYVHKGSHPLTEHFGAFEADVVLADAPETGFNHGLARRVARAGTLLVAGEAASHCVAASLRQLLGMLPHLAPRVVLLGDCMSPVAGFEAEADAFIAEMTLQGVRRMTAAQWCEEG
ncbi:MAG: isochorismatase family protein [Gemmatimonadales bacterium]|nr:isochorismatase family protein [Gemmatimonadales bacterium]